jgi:hypothetical protein
MYGTDTLEAHLRVALGHLWRYLIQYILISTPGLATRSDWPLRRSGPRSPSSMANFGGGAA